MEFLFKDLSNDYIDIQNMKIEDTLCKHVIGFINSNGGIDFLSSKERLVYEASHKIGYDRALWGYGTGIYKDYETNRAVQLHSILKMIYKGFKRCFRVVIDKEGVPWIDNLHSGIRDIIVYDNDVTIENVPHYIVDMSKDTPIIVSNGVTFDSITNIKGAIRASKARVERVSEEIKEVNHTIKEFMSLHHINKETVGVTDEMIEKYKLL